jgi:hypothetical protein
VGQPRIFATQALQAYAARVQGDLSVPPGGEQDAGHSGHGVLALAGWLSQLVQGSRAHEIALLSRLGILQQRLTRASDELQTRLAAAQQAARQAQTDWETARKARERQLHRAVLDDGLRLGKFENRLDSLGDTFVASSAASIRRLIQNDPQWSGKLKAAFRRAVRTYEQHIFQGAQAAMALTGLSVPRFNLYQTPARDEIIAAEDWVGGLAFWVGLVPGLGAPLPELPALSLQQLSLPPLIGEIGAFVGDLVDQTRMDALQQVVLSAEQTARSLLPRLHAEARRYLEHVRGLLLAVESLPPSEAENAALRARQTAQQTRHVCTALAGWCDEFQAAAARAQQAV